jgi:HEAT repeat protein
VERLIESLGDKNTRLRVGAMWALGTIGNPQAVESLIRALRDKNEWGRWQAAWALGRIGDPRALSELERVEREDTGKTPWGSVAEAAREAAEKIRGRMSSG